MVDFEIDKQNSRFIDTLNRRKGRGLLPTNLTENDHQRLYIMGGVFSGNGSPNDHFTLPTLAANSTSSLIPGATSDGATRASGGLFAAGGVKDTSDGDGGVNDATIFSFTGFDGTASVVAETAGTSSGTPNTFTAGDPGLIDLFIDNPKARQTSFLGDGPSGDGRCNVGYFGLVATLDVASITPPPPSSPVPEPASVALLCIGLASLQLVHRRTNR